MVDLLADPQAFTEGLFESENVLGDAGLVPLEVLGRPGVWNAAAATPLP